MGLPLRPLLWRELVSHPALPEPHRPPTRVVLAAILKDLRLFEALLRRDVVAALDTSSNNARNQKAWSLILLLLLFINHV